MPTPAELLAGANGVGLQLVVVAYGNRRLAVLMMNQAKSVVPLWPRSCAPGGSIFRRPAIMSV